MSNFFEVLQYDRLQQETLIDWYNLSQLNHFNLLQIVEWWQLGAGWNPNRHPGCDIRKNILSDNFHECDWLRNMDQNLAIECIEVVENLSQKEKNKILSVLKRDDKLRIGQEQKIR